MNSEMEAQNAFRFRSLRQAFWESLSMRILVPVDASRHSLQAVQYLLGNDALRKDADIEFVTVVKALPLNLTRYLTDEQIHLYVEEESKAVLDPILPLIEGDVHSSATTLIGEPIEALTEHIKARLPDLIVMGARGMHNIKSWLLGSVSRGVLAASTTPMLLLRGNTPAVNRPLKIGIAVDGSEYGWRAAEFVVKHPELFGDCAEVHVIFVADNVGSAVLPTITASTVRPSSAENLARYREVWDAAAGNVEKLLKSNGIPYLRACLVGSPAEEIVGYAEEHELDLLVMGSHGYGNFTTMFLGSTTLRVGALCEKPLLVIR